MIPRPPSKPQPGLQVRLETLVANLEKADQAVRDGYRINLALLDQESLAIAKALKAKPDRALHPLLQKAVSNLERLTATLETRVADLKNRTE